MLKKILIICALAICGMISLHAMPSRSIEQTQNEENGKDLTPGALVCNGKEDKCFKDGDQEESSSSNLFSVFCEDHQDEEQLLACKNCH